MKPKTYRKRSVPPSLVNQGTLTKSLLESISRHSGFSIEDVVRSGKSRQVRARRVGIWLLIEAYGWTHQAVADVFRCSASAVHHSFTKVDRELRDKDLCDSLLPFINKVTDDLEL